MLVVGGCAAPAARDPLGDPELLPAAQVRAVARRDATLKVLPVQDARPLSPELLRQGLDFVIEQRARERKS